MDNPPRELRSRILLHMNAWGESASVDFAETQGTGQVRIARLDSPADMAGYWSYIGTEILEADDDEPTLNLDGFTARTSDAEFRRVVRHEAGHTLGFEHEHMRSAIVKRIDRAKAIAYFDRTEGWTPEEVDEQVLTPLSKRSIMGTARRRSPVHHVLSAPGLDHEGPEAGERGERHQPEGLRLCRVALSEGEPGQPAEGAGRHCRDPNVSRRGRRHVSPYRDGRVSAGGRWPGECRAYSEVHPAARKLWWGSRHVDAAPARGQGRGNDALRPDHRHARTNQGLHQSRTRGAAKRRPDGPVRGPALRDAHSR